MGSIIMKAYLSIVCVFLFFSCLSTNRSTLFEEEVELTDVNQIDWQTVKSLHLVEQNHRIGEAPRYRSIVKITKSDQQGKFNVSVPDSFEAEQENRPDLIQFSNAKCEPISGDIVICKEIKLDPREYELIEFERTHAHGRFKISYKKTQYSVQEERINTTTISLHGTAKVFITNM